MIKTLLWDVDGTLLDFGKAEEYGIRKCFEIFSLGECTDEMLSRYSLINKKYWEMLERGELTKPQVLRGRFEEFFKTECIGFDKIDDFNLEYQYRLGDKVFFCDNALETVQSLKGKVRQYAVTNGTFVAQSRKLSQSGLDKIFDDVFISDKIGFEKPSVDFFNAVEEKIGKFNSRETMIIGDSLTSDIRGGNNANILCCWYNPKGDKPKTSLKIDYEITNISQVIDIIE
ncbi:MAG: YjjG family noncanonical pyrimidine nucleotidase [Clostridia bacterium]|nr:YjjG family noncanonical pyrimidine nucleotidase [Clostridia bacterium]